VCDNLFIMWISAINLNNYRCFKSLQLTAFKDLNIIVGENNIGKSSVFNAISKLIRVAWDTEPYKEVFQQTDIRYNNLSSGPVFISCIFSLEPHEMQDILNFIARESFDQRKKGILYRHLKPLLSNLEVVFEWSETSVERYSKLGPLFIHKVSFGLERIVEGSIQNMEQLLNQLVSPQYKGNLDELLQQAKVWSLHTETSYLLSIIRPKFSYFEEFRARPSRRERTDALSSLEGSQTANVLLNLKNHVDRQQRDRYIGIKYAFSSLFPALKIEAVESGPGTGIADIQFREIGNRYPVPLENVGAGVIELLTLLTNLITLRNHIFVIEEPELHLHPHAKRCLGELIQKAARKNQVFVITHDPVFLNPDYIHKLSRFYIKTKKGGTTVASFSSNLSTRDIGQINTAVKDLSKREVFFSRAILFVEDESQEKFIIECAKKLGFSLDNMGLSIIEVGGKDGFGPYVKLAEQLNIPFMCLADLSWGSSPDKPLKVYRSLGYELEEYLQKVGLDSLMEQARRKVGRNKPRIARYCGEHIEVNQIPQVISQLINDAVKLCKK